MAILMLINADTAVNDLQYLFDVVNIYEDDHTFTPTELERYDFLPVNGTKAEVEAFLSSALPKFADAYLWDDDNKWHFSDETDGEILDEVQVYQLENDTRWYKYIVEFRFPVNVGALTAEEKQLLASYDITHPSVDNFVRKIIKDLAADPANQEEIKDLKGDQPE